MYLRGDISILVPAVFRTIVAILTAPAVHTYLCQETCPTCTLIPLSNFSITANICEYVGTKIHSWVQLAMGCMFGEGKNN